MNFATEEAATAKRMERQEVWVEVSLHSSTSPEAIAETQRRAVLAFLSGRKMSARQVSEGVCLPEDVVRRRMREIARIRRRKEVSA